MLRFEWPCLARRSSAPRRAPGVKVNLAEFDQYVRSADEVQNAVDLVPGWNNPLPPDAGAKAGGGCGLFTDPRVVWAIEQFGDIRGAKVMEIGPMEASHTYMLEQAGAQVRAVEANKLAYIKCLIVKEMLGLKARFSLAEINEWLRATTGDYDLVFACGVLYHMRDPVTLLELLAQRTSAIYLWTHYATEKEVQLAEANEYPYLVRERRLGLDLREIGPCLLRSREKPGLLRRRL